MNYELKIYLFLIIGMMLIAGCSEDEPVLGDYPGDGLVSYFPFDGNIDDVMDNSIGGVNHNSASFTSGKFGKAITFNGVDEYVDYTARSYQTNNEVSISLWFKTHLTSGTVHPLIYCSEFTLRILHINAMLSINFPATYSVVGGVITDTWIHLVGIYDGNNISIYVNSLLADATNHTGNFTADALSLTLGKWGSHFLNGSIDDVFIYQRALDESEVIQLYER